MSAEIERQMRMIAEGTATSYGCAAEVAYSREFVPLLNDPDATGAAMFAAASVFGDDRVSTKRELMTASEDFARFLNHVPGCFAFIGNGEFEAPPQSRIRF